MDFQEANGFNFGFIDTTSELVPYYLLVFSTALDLIFFPVLTLVVTQFWNMVLRFFGYLMGLEKEERGDIADDVTVVKKYFRKKRNDVSPLVIAIILRRPDHVKALLEFGVKYFPSEEAGRRKIRELSDLIGVSYRKIEVDDEDNAVETARLLLEYNLVNRESLLSRLKKRNYPLFKTLLNSHESLLLSALEEGKFLKDVLSEKMKLPKEKALLRSEGSQNMQIQSNDLALFMKEHIQYLIDKDPPVHVIIRTALQEMVSVKSVEKPQSLLSDDQISRLVTALNDIERASVKISESLTQSPAFKNIPPATFKVIAAQNFPEEDEDLVPQIAKRPSSSEESSSKRHKL